MSRALRAGEEVLAPRTKQGINEEEVMAERNQYTWDEKESKLFICAECLGEVVVNYKDRTRIHINADQACPWNPSWVPPATMTERLRVQCEGLKQLIVFKGWMRDLAFYMHNPAYRFPEDKVYTEVRRRFPLVTAAEFSHLWHEVKR